MPYTRKVLIFKGTRVKPAGTPISVGEHVLKKRLEDGLGRKELATRIGVDESTLMNWELGRSRTIPVNSMPAVIFFLQYNPEPEPSPENVGARLKWKRRSLGWSAREAARRNCVDPSTWGCWENQEGWPRYPRYRTLLIGFLEASNDVVASSVRQVRPALVVPGLLVEPSDPIRPSSM